MAIEDEFHDAMVNIYMSALKLGYNAHYFTQMVESRGGLETARYLLSSESPQYGFTRLWELKRLDLTVECLVLGEQWRGLFTDAQLIEARTRLQAHDIDSNIVEQCCE